MNHVLLNPIEHRNLYIAPLNPNTYEANVDFALMVPGELRVAQSFYPIFLQKDVNTGKFFLSALLGFQEGENLYLDTDSWNAHYIPLSVARQPFLIGQQSYSEQGVQKTQLVITLDMDNPRVNHNHGERLFTDTGEATEYVNQVADMLDALHKGLLEADQFIDRLIAYNLIEQATLNVTFNEHKRYQLTNLYTINEDVLGSLPNEAIVSLFKSGDLENIYAILHSQGHISTLINLKKQQDLR